MLQPQKWSSRLPGPREPVHSGRTVAAVCPTTSPKAQSLRRVLPGAQAGMKSTPGASGGRRASGKQPAGKDVTMSAPSEVGQSVGDDPTQQVRRLLGGSGGSRPVAIAWSGPARLAHPGPQDCSRLPGVHARTLPRRGDAKRAAMGDGWPARPVGGPPPSGARPPPPADATLALAQEPAAGTSGGKATPRPRSKG